MPLCQHISCILPHEKFRTMSAQVDLASEPTETPVAQSIIGTKHMVTEHVSKYRHYNFQQGPKIACASGLPPKGPNRPRGAQIAVTTKQWERNRQHMPGKVRIRTWISAASLPIPGASAACAAGCAVLSGLGIAERSGSSPSNAQGSGGSLAQRSRTPSRAKRRRELDGRARRSLGGLTDNCQGFRGHFFLTKVQNSVFFPPKGKYKIFRHWIK